MKFKTKMEKAKREHIVDIIVSDENTGIVEIVKGGFGEFDEWKPAASRILDHSKADASVMDIKKPENTDVIAVNNAKLDYNHSQKSVCYNPKVKVRAEPVENAIGKMDTDVVVDYYSADMRFDSKEADCNTAKGDTESENIVSDERDEIVTKEAYSNGDIGNDTVDHDIWNKNESMQRIKHAVRQNIVVTDTANNEVDEFNQDKAVKLKHGGDAERICDSDTAEKRDLHIANAEICDHRRDIPKVRHWLSTSIGVEILETEVLGEEDISNDSIKMEEGNIDATDASIIELNVGKMVKIRTSIDDSNLSEIDETNSDVLNADEIEVSSEDESHLEDDLDEEVEGIMKSSEMLDKISNEVRRSVREKQLEEAQLYRKRRKSIDNATIGLRNFNFAKYGISVGVGSANDLLPGIEEFLCTVLEKETLSPYAEEQRQYFLERLDIIKLPPSIPPRPQSLGVRLYPVSCSPTPVPDPNSIPSIEQEDFAAYQRELSRALVDSENSPEPLEIEVKVYDDIDPADVSSTTDVVQSQKDEEESLYEIPQIQRNLNDSGYEKAVDVSAASRSTSSDEVLLTPGPPLPPPLPPRGRSASDAASRSSIGSMLDERTQDLIQQALPLNRASSISSHKNNSEKSSDDVLDENTDDQFDRISCDSLDDTAPVKNEPDLEILTTLGVKLPQLTKKKRKHNSQRLRTGQSLLSLRETTQPFRSLEDVTLSGELHYKSKLSWNKKMAALCNGRLVCYKADKLDTRPSFVILLTGYHATFQKREGRRCFEINLTHDYFESHLFLADFKEWAETWCEHINHASEGKKAAGPVLHLARGAMLDNIDGTYNAAKSSLQSSNSNLSVASSDDFDSEPGTIKVKKRDHSGIKTAKMGTFAYRATQFFESLGKKPSVKKGGSRNLSLSQSSLCEQISPLTPESGIVESPLEGALVESPLHFATVESPLKVSRHIKHQGFLDIYSSFNKRKWGKRWCMVHENSFECYRTQSSEVCELEFLLRNCILRRAIEETKSELGLMLMENNREKITIEPMNWTELGSWLRVLMRETSTTVTPDGLEAYMDDSNPYHEAVEITQLSDPFPSPATVSPVTNDRTLPTADSEDDKRRQLTPSHKNRDSGNCSSESAYGSLERKQTHPCYTDSNLPRVSVHDTGDIYTQVRKSSTSLVKYNDRNSDSQNKKQGDQSGAKNSSKTEKTEGICKNTENRAVFDFENCDGEMSSYNRGESLVDEIMSQFNTQISSGFELDNVGDTSQNLETETDYFGETNFQNSSGSGNPAQTRRASAELSKLETMFSPIKDKSCHSSSGQTDSTKTDNYLCSSFVEGDQMSSYNNNHFIENGALDISNNEHINNSNPNTGADVINCDIKTEQGQTTAGDSASVGLREKSKDQFENCARKRSSLVNNEARMTETLEELRTRLVQLKKDRISIRDRKQKTSSQIDKDYLEAEFNRLNRECAKVDEEITYLEKLRNSEQKGSETAGTIDIHGSLEEKLGDSEKSGSGPADCINIQANVLNDIKSKSEHVDEDKKHKNHEQVSQGRNNLGMNNYKESEIEIVTIGDMKSSESDTINSGDGSTKSVEIKASADMSSESQNQGSISEEANNTVTKTHVDEHLSTKDSVTNDPKVVIDKLTEDFEKLLHLGTDS